MAYQLPSWACDYSDKDLDDKDILQLIKDNVLVGVRWLDLRFNQITDSGLEALCAAHLPDLEVVALFGNPCQEPCEKYRTVGLDGEIIASSIVDRPIVISLEAKYGKRVWLHPIANYGDSFPPPKSLLRMDPEFVENPLDEESFEEDNIHYEATVGRLATRHGELVIKSFTDTLADDEIKELDEIRSKLDAMEELSKQNTLTDYIVEGITRYLDAKMDDIMEEEGSEERLNKAKNYLKTAIKTMMDHYPRTQDIKRN